MAYYLILNFDIHDPEVFSEYARASAQIERGTMKILAVDRQPNDLEGQSKQNLILVAFEDEAAALAWYNSDAYAAVRKLRQQSTTGWLRGVPGFS